MEEVNQGLVEWDLPEFAAARREALAAPGAEPPSAGLAPSSLQLGGRVPRQEGRMGALLVLAVLGVVGAAVVGVFGLLCGSS